MGKHKRYATIQISVTVNSHTAPHRFESWPVDQLS